MSGEPLNNTTIDPTLLQRLTQNYQQQTPNQLSGFSQLNISTESNDYASDGAINITSPSSTAHPVPISIGFSAMNDPSSAPGTAPININRSSTFGANNNNQQLSGSAA
ncbi:hypothetical protein GGI22_006184, partial [Coemansia erecta]